MVVRRLEVKSFLHQDRDGWVGGDGGRKRGEGRGGEGRGRTLSVCGGPTQLCWDMGPIYFFFALLFGHSIFKFLGVAESP